jgi:hypothetical protein
MVLTESQANYAQNNSNNSSRNHLENRLVHLGSLLAMFKPGYAFSP